MNDKLAFIPNDPESYRNLNIKPDEPAQWEDGIRTSTEPGTFEWWYFDSYLEDGTTIVMIFFTKPLMDINKKLMPYAVIDVNFPDGQYIHREYHGTPDEFSASKEHCDVKIGKNYFKGDLEHYEIFFTCEDLTVEVTLNRRTASWRPDTGFQYYGKAKEHYLAWFVAVPDGELQATINYQGDIKKLNGAGYHDHNWGNALMASLIHHWYWARIKIGGYVIICFMITSEKNYNYDTIPMMMIAKDGKVIAEHNEKMQLFQSDGRVHEATGKPLSNILKFIYEDDNEKYELTLNRHKDLIAVYLADKGMVGFKKFLAKMIRYDGAYFRFKGTAKLEHYIDGNRTESFETNDAIWELMYFGKGKTPSG